MLKRWISLSIIAVTISILAPVSTAMRARAADGKVDATENPLVQSEVPASRLARLRHGINLSHWFAQSVDYSKAHLESHTISKARFKGLWVEGFSRCQQIQKDDEAR